MLIKFFRNGQGGGAGPVDYLVEREVVAYDDNRNGLRDSDGNVLMFEREPLPDVLRGDPERMRHLIDACEHQWSYRAGVLSFTNDDAPTPEQQRKVMDAFEGLAFAGLEADQSDILWVRHSHEGRVELHFVTPRMELATGRSLNIAPPGYQKTYDALRDVLNKEHAWNDPQAPERACEVKSLIESVQRGEGREQIHDWILDRVEAGEIHNRTDMTEQLTDAGFEIPRAGKNYITVHDPASDQRWRLKGDIFREDWTRENALEREMSEKLKDQAESQANNQADQAAALMASQLKRFENDCTTSLNDAQLTIENDIQLLLNHSAQLSRSVRPIILTATLIATIVILLSLITSWIFASAMIEKAQKASLWQMGLTINQTENGKVLTWDTMRLRQIDCRSGSEPVPCLQIIERK